MTTSRSVKKQHVPQIQTRHGVLQVTGVEVRGRGSSTRHSSPASMTGRVAWAHLATPPARGGAPPRGPLANTYSSSSSSGYNQGSSSSFSSSSGFNQGSSSSSGYNQGSSSSSSSGYNQGSSMSSLPVGNSPFGPIETPAYANTLPRATSKGAAKHVDIVDTRYCRYCRYYLEPVMLPITPLSRLAR